MFNQITFYPIFGKPLIMWGGIITICFFFFGAYLGNAALKGKAKISQHLLVVKIAIALAIIHGALGIASFF